MNDDIGLGLEKQSPDGGLFAQIILRTSRRHDLGRPKLRKRAADLPPEESISPRDQQTAISDRSHR
jgi:hypothetical protein